MNDESDILCDTKRLEDAVQIVPVFNKAVAIGSGIIQLLTVAHADEVRRDASALIF